jgi:fluoride exporter
MTVNRSAAHPPPVPTSSAPRRLGRLLVPALVFLGGAFGTAVRYEFLVFAPWGHGLPVVFVINVTGALLLGVLIGWLPGSANPGRATELMALLGTGILGGYTTYGTFAVDTNGLIDMSHFGIGSLYGLATVVFGSVAALGGMLTAERLRRARRHLIKANQ